MSLNGLCIKCETELYGQEATLAAKRRFRRSDGGFEHYDTDEAIEHNAQSPVGVLSLYCMLPDGRWIVEGWYGAREVPPGELPGELAALIAARQDSTPADPPDDQPSVWISFAGALLSFGITKDRLSKLCKAGKIQSRGDHKGREVNSLDLMHYIAEREKNGGN